MSKDTETKNSTQNTKNTSVVSELDFHATPQSRRRRIRNSVAMSARRAGRF